jgi:hypothetical protein
MTTLTSNSDIIRDVLFRAGEPTDGTSDFYTATIEYLNRAYRDVWMGGGALIEDMNEPWLWLKKDPPGTLTIIPVINAGGVQTTNGSTAIVFSVIPQDYSGNVSVTGRFFKVDATPDVFRIATHTSGSTSATLDTPYTGTTSLTGTQNYKVMTLEYTLAADMLRVISPMRIYAQNKYEVEGVDLISLERDQPLSYVQSGVPTRFALVTESKVRFNKYGGLVPTELMRIEYDYLAAPVTELGDDANQNLIPLVHRQVLADMTLYYLFVSKSDLRAELIGAQAKASLRSMAKDNQARRAQMGRQVGGIITRPTKFNRFDRVLRTTSGLIVG